MEGGMLMGRQKLGNPNSQRNNNARKMKKQSEIAHSGSYSEIEAQKMQNNQTKK